MADPIDRAEYRVIEALRSVKPKRTGKRTETRACDCISRQAVTDTVRTIILGFFSDSDGAMTDTEKMLLSVSKAICNGVRELPSAQPEIIRCKDCKWYGLPSHRITENCVKWRENNGVLLPIKPTDFCSYAERREE